MLQLVAYLPNEVRRFPLARSPLTVGSSSECEISLPFPGVAERHLRVERDSDAILLENLGLEGSLLVNGESAEQARIELLDEIRLGRVTLLLEDFGQVEDPLEAEESPVARSKPVSASARLLLERISILSDWVLGDAESAASLESHLLGLLQDFGGGACYVFQGDAPQRTVRLAVVTDPSWLEHGEALEHRVQGTAHPGPTRSIGHVSCPLGAPEETGDGEPNDGREVWCCFRYSAALDRPHLTVFAFERFTPSDWSPELGLSSVADLIVLGLIHHVGRYEPILPGATAKRSIALAPGFVEGPSAAVRQLIDRLRTAAGGSCSVVLVGEEGSGRELAARTLHLSSERAQNVFGMASCCGAEARMIEADLFGAEVPGRAEPVRRLGKLQLAAGGTLYLDRVDELPLELQSRLARALRAGVIEGLTGEEPVELDVRLICSSSRSLASRVSGGTFRADLAHRLGELTIPIPPLRHRLEDLPILVQTYVNRFSHETGKRVRGITVQCLTALSAYSFPGNLRELENAIRQVVYLVADQAPIDVDLLPDEIRTSGAGDSSADDGGELDLAARVTGVEIAAIREAIRRAGGNKSQAARLLGLSRNGLTQKMARYQIRA